MDTITLFLMPFLGVALGVLTGALGTGGGLLAVPLLVLICGLDQKQAQGAALVMITISVAKSLKAYHRQGSLDLGKRTLVLAAVGGVMAVISAVWAIRQASPVLQMLYGSFLFFLAAFNWLTKHKSPLKTALPDAWSWTPGVLGGASLGLFGVGGAALVTPLLRIFFGVPQLAAQGMSLVFALPGILLGLGVYVTAGHVAWIPGILLAVGGFVGAGYGVRWARNTSPATLSATFTGILLLAGTAAIAAAQV